MKLMTKFKKTMALILSLAMIFSLVPMLKYDYSRAYADEVQLEGKGTSSDPYLIKTGKDMEEYAKAARNKLTTCGKLVNDIDMSKYTEEWIPIGKENFPYEGTFNGNNKKIIGFSPKKTETTTSTIYSNYGLFGCIGKTGSVKDLTLNGVILSRQNITGGICGSNEGTIRGCKSDVAITVENEINDKIKVGGIVGENYGVVEACLNKGAITVEVKGATVGGVIGYAPSGNDIKSCVNHGNIHLKTTGTKSESGKLGGVLGHGPAFRKKIQYCYNTGNLTAEGEKNVVGGLIGFSNFNANLLNSYNSGNSLNPILGGKNANRHVKFNEDTNKPDVFWTQSGNNTHTPIAELNTKEFVENKLNGKDDGVDDSLKFVPNPDSGKTPLLKWELQEEEEQPEPEPEKVPIDKVSIEIKDKDKGILEAVVTGKGGKEPTGLTYQWERCTEDYYDDLLEEDVIEFEEIPNAKEKTITITEEIKSKFSKYKVIVKDNSGSRKEAEINYKLPEQPQPESPDEKYLNEILKKVQINLIRPVYGKDVNANECLKEKLKAKGYEGVEVEVKTVEKTGYPNGGTVAKIDGDGSLTYFFTDPLTIAKPPMNNANYARFEVTFKLKKGEAVRDFKTKIDLYWDADKLKESLKEQVIDKINFDLIKDQNKKEDEITEDLKLIHYMGENRNTPIYWISSDEGTIKIEEPKGDADTVLFGPRIGKVNRGTEDKDVTLTATIEYRVAETEEANAKIKELKKEFHLTVKKAEAENPLKKELAEKLENGLKKAGIRDFSTGEVLDLNDVKGNIKFPTTKDFGVDGKYQPVTIESSNENVIEPWKTIDGNEILKNAATVKVYRPLPGKNPEKVVLTIKITDKATGVFAKKDIEVTVTPLAQKEIDDAKQFMSNAKKEYFNGIKNENTDANNITKDMRVFQEIMPDGNDKVKFIYDSKDRHFNGIMADTKEETTDALKPDSQYSRFVTSKPNVLVPDVLRIEKKPEYDKNVKISSFLTHEVYGKYYVKAKKDNDADTMNLFKDLYRQPVSVDVIVKGKKGVDPTPDATITVSFELKGLKGVTWIAKENVTVAKDATVYDVFEKMTKEKNFTYKGDYNYISEITNEKGETLRHKEHGPNSGWLYKVNNVVPKVHIGAYEAKNGDSILVTYTENYKNEEGIVWVGEDKKPDEKKDKEDKEEPQDINPVEILAKLKVVARTQVLKNNYVRVRVIKEGDIKALEQAGYTVKYKFYRSSNPKKGYKLVAVRKTNTYKTKLKKGRNYFRARIFVYDKDGKLVSKTEYKQCKYGKRTVAA